MKQMSFAAGEYVKKPKQTRKERFLQEMEAVVAGACYLYTRLIFLCIDGDYDTTILHRKALSHL